MDVLRQLEPARLQDEVAGLLRKVEAARGAAELRFEDRSLRDRAKRLRSGSLPALRR